MRIIKKKYLAVFTVRQLKTHNIIGIKRFNPTDKSISFKRHSFVIDIENPSYINGNKIYYFFSITSEHQLSFYKFDKPNVNAEVIDTIMNQHIVKQLTSNLNNEWKMNLIQIVIGIAIGAPIGYLVCQYLMSRG